MLNHLSARKAVLLSMLIMLGILAAHAVRQIPELMAAQLPNPDSYTRLVLLRDHLPGGGFQFMARDNAPFGAYMHWSMVHSWVMLCLARGLMALGLALEPALLWAGAGLTMISMVVLAGLAAGTVAARSGRLAAIAATLVLISSLPLLGYGQLLQLTHHVFMLIPLTAAACCFLGAATGFRDLIGGVLMGLALWISPETMPFVVGLTAVRIGRLLQDTHPAPAWPAALGLMASLSLGWTLDPPPPTFTPWALDHISLAWLTLGLLLALLMALADKISRLPIPLKSKVGWLLLAGLLGGAAWLFLTPGALAGPEGLLPDLLKRLWWSHIHELRPATHSVSASIGFLLMPLMAGAALLWMAWREAVLWKALLAAVTLGYALLAAWHVRMGAAASLAAALAWGLALCRLPAFTTEQVNALSRRQQYRAAALLAAPLLVALASLTVATLDKTPPEQRSEETCQVSDIAPYLNTLPTGTVFASLNSGPEILWRTRHGIIASNYHHNVDGLLDHFSIQRSAGPDAALSAILQRRKIRVLLACSAESRGNQAEEDMLMARMEKGESIQGLDGPTRFGLWNVYSRPDHVESPQPIRGNTPAPDAHGRAPAQ